MVSSLRYLEDSSHLKLRHTCREAVADRSLGLSLHSFHSGYRTRDPIFLDRFEFLDRLSFAVQNSFPVRSGSHCWPSNDFRRPKLRSATASRHVCRSFKWLLSSEYRRDETRPCSAIQMVDDCHSSSLALQVWIYPQYSVTTVVRIYNENLRPNMVC